MSENGSRYKVGDMVVVKKKMWGKLSASQLSEPKDRLFSIERVGKSTHVLSADDMQYYGTWQKNSLSDALKGMICESWVSVAETKVLKKEA
ncbi:hypothetical protein ES705_42573 [subsurface metagenome]